MKYKPETISNCCGAGVNPDILICHDCQDHCSVVSWCDKCNGWMDEADPELVEEVGYWDRRCAACKQVLTTVQ